MKKLTVNTKIINIWHSRKETQTTATFFKRLMCLNKQYRFNETNNPNFVFSICQQRFQFPGNYVRIFFAGENIKPKMNQCDWAFGFEFEDHMDNHPRYMRIPNYVRLGGGRNLIKQNVNIEKLINQKTKFCAFVSRNPRMIRSKFFSELSKYKKVDAPGSLCNNMRKLDLQPRIKKLNLPNGYARKLEFYKPYKFIIAIENESYPGYTTEKLYHGMLANCIGIYWGNPLIHREFNTKSFINCHDVKHRSAQQQIEYMVERVIELDKDDVLYAEALKQPYLPENRLTRYMNPTRIIKRFKEIFKK